MIERLAFGRTGHDSSRLIFGAAALATADQRAAYDAVELLLEHGINHIDTAADYGESETLLGPALEDHRDAFFLATKTGLTAGRDRATAHDEIRRSLERLRTDHVDLIQLHNLVAADEWEQALGPGGALEAAVEARDEGLVRFIGVTGHGWEVARRHLASLGRHPFDSVLVPYGLWLPLYPEFEAEIETLLNRCADEGVAVQTIKTIARRPWPDGVVRHARTWYEPLTNPAEIALAVHWVLARPGVFLNTAGELGLLPLVLAAAHDFEAAPPDEAIDRLRGNRSIAAIF